MTKVNSILGLIMNLRRHGGRAVAAFVAAGVSMGGGFDTAATEIPVAIASATGGQQLFNAQCISCHGFDARGIEGLGVSLVNSVLIKDSRPQELVEFLKVGRMPTDPDSVTGLVMPGFAWVAEADLASLAQYLREIAE